MQRPSKSPFKYPLSLKMDFRKWPVPLGVNTLSSKMNNIKIRTFYFFSKYKRFFLILSASLLVSSSPLLGSTFSEKIIHLQKPFQHNELFQSHCFCNNYKEQVSQGRMQTLTLTRRLLSQCIFVFHAFREVFAPNWELGEVELGQSAVLLEQYSEACNGVAVEHAQVGRQRNKGKRAGGRQKVDLAAGDRHHVVPHT